MSKERAPDARSQPGGVRDVHVDTYGPAGVRQRELLMTLKVSVPDVSAFDWNVIDGMGRRVCGITDDLRHALDEVLCTLGGSTASSAQGTIRPARLDSLAAGGPAYVYGEPLARFHRDPATGAVHIGPPPSTHHLP